MSTHASTKIDQKEYLKKYLSGDTGKKKKKDKKNKHSASAKVKIIDDDAFVSNEHGIDEELLQGGEDAPQIVGTYIEENPVRTELKWKSIVIKDEDDDETFPKQAANVEADLWGKAALKRRIKDEFSPTHRQNSRTPDISPQRRRNGRNSPGRRLSPSRRQRDCSPTKRNNKELAGRSPGSDQSPPRRDRKRSAHGSPVRRKSKDRLNQSPPRRRKHNVSPSRMPSKSPSRIKREWCSVDDQSPPRRRNTDLSPPRRRAPSKSPTRKQRESRCADQSLPRRRNSDLSPPRRRIPSISPGKIKREKRTPDISPPPVRNRSRWQPRDVSRSASPPPSHKPKMTKTLDGKCAGLQNAQALQVENLDRRQKEEKVFANMSSEVSGRDAEVQVRNSGRRGRRAREAEVLTPEEQQRKEAHEKKKKELYDRWGKGLKQIEAHRARVDEEQYEGSKPLARYSNDEDLERHLREQERADDPMLEYMRQKNNDRQKNNKVAKMPTYQGSYPENRFGIRPGYRWDGVDRSNGYEKKWFDVQNEKRAIQDEAYKYSVEDM